MEVHKHNFSQVFSFLGGDPDDILKLNGEVELILIEDGVKLEKHNFTKATSVFIPKGLYHCPLVFKRVDMPFIFAVYHNTAEYKRLK
jgi:hypothetical protein